MTGRFEEDVRQAYASFIAQIERAVIAAIQAAFAQMSTRAIDVAGAPGAESPASDPLWPRRVPASRRAPTRTLDAAELEELRKQLISCIHDNPGSTTAQLGQRLGIHVAKVRRQLMRLDAEGALRCEERPSGFAHQQCRVYFPAPREVPHVTNVNGQTYGAHSAAPTTVTGESP